MYCNSASGNSPTRGTYWETKCESSSDKIYIKVVVGLSNFSGTHLVHKAHLASIANCKGNAGGNDQPVHDIEEGVVGVLLRQLHQEDDGKDGIEEAGDDPLPKADHLSVQKRLRWIQRKKSQLFFRSFLKVDDPLPKVATFLV